MAILRSAGSGKLLLAFLRPCNLLAQGPMTDHLSIVDRAPHLMIVECIHKLTILQLASIIRMLGNINTSNLRILQCTPNFKVLGRTTNIDLSHLHINLISYTHG